jgi:hypothetical protein
MKTHLHWEFLKPMSASPPLSGLRQGPIVSPQLLYIDRSLCKAFDLLLRNLHTGPSLV